jgi:hypothetical protein
VALPYRILNYDEKRPLGKSGYRWEDNIKMVPEETVCECVDWIQFVVKRFQ